MSKLIGNLIILIAGAFLVAGAMIGISILFAYAFTVAVLRRLKGISRAVATS